MGVNQQQNSLWMRAFVDAVDFTIYIADLLRALTQHQLSIPCLAPYIPPPLRAPWAHYN